MANPEQPAPPAKVEGRFATLAAICAGVAVVTFLGVIWMVTRGPGIGNFAACQAGVVAGQAALGGPFSLIDTKGREVSDREVISEPSLIYFGYTFCPDVCPLDVMRNADAVDLLAERGVSARAVFITVDPQRDTPEVVGDFAAAAHPKMVALTGSTEQVKAAARAFRVYYQAQPADDDFYLVNHSTFTYLVLPEHGVVDVIRREDPPEAVSERVACYVHHA